MGGFSTSKTLDTARRDDVTYIPSHDNATTARGHRRTTEGIAARWIVVGDLMFFLRAGEACHYNIGTTPHVVYIEQGGRNDVESITPIPGAREES